MASWTAEKFKPGGKDPGVTVVRLRGPKPMEPLTGPILVAAITSNKKGLKIIYDGAGEESQPMVNFTEFDDNDVASFEQMFVDVAAELSRVHDKDPLTYVGAWTLAGSLLSRRILKGRLDDARGE